MKAIAHLERRIAGGLLLLFAVSLLSFFLSSLVPGSFFDDMRMNPQISPETVAALRSQYGIDLPVTSRYIHWLKSALRGDLGFSFAYNAPVSSLIWIRCRNTLLLGCTATFLVWLIAAPLGILSAARGGWIDRLCSLASSFLLSVPELAIALLLLVLAVHSGVAPVGGMISLRFDELGFWARARDVAAHMLLPALTLILVAFPVVLRHTRTAVQEVLDAPFLRAAKGHGIGPVRLLMRHALPAAANPIISLFGLSLAGLLSASLLVEVVTGWPGLGPLFVESIFARDFYVVISVVMLSSAFLVVGNLAADLLLCVVDPRIRAE